MTLYHLEIRVKPREGLLDPQGKAVQHALDSLGFDGVSSVRIGKVIDIEIEGDSEPEAVHRAEEMCRRLLANPVTEDFKVTAAAEPASAGGET